VPRGVSNPGSRPSGHHGKRPSTEREKDLAKIAKYDRRGYSQDDIARIVGVSQSQVSDDLKVIRSRYAVTTQEEIRILVEEKRSQLREVRAEAWRAWERSKKESLKVVEEQSSRGEYEIEKTVTTKEHRLPDATYLRVIIETLRDECALDGLNQPQKLNINAQVIDWGELFARTVESEVNQVEQKLAQIQADVEGRSLLSTPLGEIGKEDARVKE
jgi:predicted transcriptional regulator